MLKAKLAVLVSGGGTNLQALIDAQNKKILKSGVISLVISNNPNAYALIRAVDNNIPIRVISQKEFESRTAFENAVADALEEFNIDLIVLAGFMCILSEQFTSRYPDRIINIHPSLIPAFCGKGYYGLKVHEAALKRGVKITGATVHFVNEIPDGGKIILQKSVSVRNTETPESLQRRVMEQAEWEILPRAAEMISKKILKE